MIRRHRTIYVYCFARSFHKMRIQRMDERVSDRVTVSHWYIVPLGMKVCICHFVKWQIHPFISKGTNYVVTANTTMLHTDANLPCWCHLFYRLHHFKWHGVDSANKSRMIPNHNQFTQLAVVQEQFYYNVSSNIIYAKTQFKCKKYSI